MPDSGRTFSRAVPVRQILRGVPAEKVGVVPNGADLERLIPQIRNPRLAARLELRPEQAETLTRARQSGSLALALRSIADVNAPERAAEGGSSKRGNNIEIVRYGVTSSHTAQK